MYILKQHITCLTIIFELKVLTKVFEIAKVIPAWLGAMSAWLLRWPDELQALNPMDTDTKLKIKNNLCQTLLNVQSPTAKITFYNILCFHINRQSTI